MSIELTILMPCLNEVRTVAACVAQARAFIDRSGISGEVVVADNGSEDGSIASAEGAGARVIGVEKRGYGAALAAGIESARGQYIIMGDADGSYDFSELMPFIRELRAGADFVVGNRFKGGIARGAMPVLHRYVGNPMLTALGRRFFRCEAVGDFYCGLRGFRKEAIERLQLQSSGMEFALEMIIKAQMHGALVKEVPTTLSPDGRDRPPHLRSYRDGWRSLRLYLLLSPRWFFAVPGSVLFVTGGAGFILLLPGAVSFGNISFDYHTLLYCGAAIVLGYQALIMAVIAKRLAVESGLHPAVRQFSFLEKRESFERLLILGAGFVVLGVALGCAALRGWSEAHFGPLSPTRTIRFVISSVLALILGGQTALAGCFLGLLNFISERRSPGLK
jgi:glycosyltransferase involved in cell wall biosynthesis